MILVYQDGPGTLTRALARRWREDRSQRKDARLLALKMGEGATSQGKQGAS